MVSSFFTNTKGGQSNNIEESTVMSLFASGYETKVSFHFVCEHTLLYNMWQKSMVTIIVVNFMVVKF